eukprot:TRINITY_DN108852_c0_g1_i1.p1 TRINITY_DN108852_c0_g1~~TRINITY_DN108852_c0_g1_i1.p1  ORF type:complete len:627 (-),score=99.96 TRINITY_DN108852_c0_g1_i1:153-2033(-)
MEDTGTLSDATNMTNYPGARASVDASATGGLPGRTPESSPMMRSKEVQRTPQRSQTEAARRRALKVPREGIMIRVTNVFDIYKQVRTLVTMISNVWGWSLSNKTNFRQVMPGLIRIHCGANGAGSDSFVIPGFFLQELDLAQCCVLPSSGDLFQNSTLSEKIVQDIHLKQPSKYFGHIKILLKLRWLLRLHSAGCELDYKMCSMRNLIMGIQYVVLQQCAEVEADSIFDTKVSQHVGAHVNVESVIDDIVDQLARALGSAFRPFLQFVATCDPNRSVQVSQMDSPMTEAPIVSNDNLAIALDTIFLTYFLRQCRKEKDGKLQGLYEELDQLGIPLPQVSSFNQGQHLRTWTRAQTKPTRVDREKVAHPDHAKLTQLDAVLFTAAVELHSSDIMASREDQVGPEAIANAGVPRAPGDGAPEPVDFGSTGSADGVLGPPAARVILREKPQLAPQFFEAACLLIHAHMTFPTGIRERLYSILTEEYGLTEAQTQRLAVATTQNIDGKRLTDDHLVKIVKKEKTRLKQYSEMTGKDTFHLLQPSLVSANLHMDLPPKYTLSPPRLVKKKYDSSVMDMSRSLPNFGLSRKLEGRQPFKVPLSTGPLTMDPDLKKLRTTGYFIKMPPLKGQF